MKEKFFECVELGMLEIEKVLFSSNYPILFTCRNEGNELYLCVCCQNNEVGKKWMLAETNPDNIVRMLENEITMREAFILPNKKRYSIFTSGTQNVMNVIKNEDPEEWDADNSIDLPDKGEYIDAEEDEFIEEIRFYRNSIMECFRFKMECFCAVVNMNVSYSQQTYNEMFEIFENMPSYIVSGNDKYIVSDNDAKYVA